MDPAAAALKGAVGKDGKLRLRNFARVKQLGSGDVGMVDLVQLVGGTQRFALKSLDKREMLERNKVGRGLGLGLARIERGWVKRAGQRASNGHYGRQAGSRAVCAAP
jgi:hypothetical protein